MFSLKNFVLNDVYGVTTPGLVLSILITSFFRQLLKMKATIKIRICVFLLVFMEECIDLFCLLINLDFRYNPSKCLSDYTTRNMKTLVGIIKEGEMQVIIEIPAPISAQTKARKALK